ncbi:MAG: hypothetical protein OXG39_15830 [Chloroflexi bacterium]|nr:hypothetical protein [Chloroflexota bacterium]
MNFDDYYLMYLGITPPSGDDSEEPEEDPKPTYFSSYVSVYVKPDPKPATTSKPTNGAADPAPANYGAPPPMYQGISSAPQPTSSSSNSGKKRDRKEETPGKPQITLPADFIQPTVAPDISAFDLEYGWWSEFGSRQPEVETDDELVGAVAKSVQNEGLFAHYLDDPIAYLKHFASYGWNAKSDRQAEAYLQKHREEMRLHYAGQDELWKGLALGATEHTRKDLTNDRWESAVAVNIVTKEEIFRRFGDEDETPLQEENREMIKDPHNTALVHNHWNDSPGSQADFDAALWLGVRYLIVVTPSGVQYIYERDGDTMKLLDEIFNREHVALPSRAETAESRKAYEAQLLAEEGNPAERVMRQGNPMDAAWEKANDAYNTSESDSAFQDYKTQVETAYDVRFTSAVNADAWNVDSVKLVQEGLEEMAAALGNWARDNGYDWDNAEAFRRIIGTVTLRNTREESNVGAQAIVSDDTISIFWKAKANRNYYLLPNVLLHELGHILNANAGLGGKDNPGSINYFAEITDSKHAFEIYARTGNLVRAYPGTREGMGAPRPDLLRTDNFDTYHMYDDSMTSLRPLHVDMEMADNHALFARTGLNPMQIQYLQYSTDLSINEITADSIVNWVHDRNTDGMFGYTDTAGGLMWQWFMDTEEDKIMRNAIVHVAIENGDATYASQIDELPAVFGSGTVQASDGVNVRSNPAIVAGNDFTSIKDGYNFLVLGRSSDNLWITTARKGKIGWMYYGGPNVNDDARIIRLPEGVNIADLPEYPDDATLDFDPNSPVTKRS